MYPVVLNIGNFSVSSFGLFLSLGIFLGGFAVWRIARGYELDPEKILDLSFLTIGFGFIISRIVYIASNLELFDSWMKVFLINKYPGLSFWGGFLGGLIALAWLSRRSKMSFLQSGDFALVGFFIAAFFAEIGCFLGGCGVGVESNFLGIDQSGFIGKRLPIQFIEALIFLFVFLRFWKNALKFHIQGSIFSKGLIIISIIKISAYFFKEKTNMIRVSNIEISIDLVVSVLILLTGLKFYYQVYKRTPLDDLKFFMKIFFDKKTRNTIVANVYKGCYNQWVNFGIGLKNLKKRLAKVLNIKSNPKQF